MAHLLGAAGIYRASVALLIPERVAFILLTLLLMLYLGVEIWWARREFPQRWMVNPAVMASFATFGMKLGFSNFVLFLPEIAQARLSQNHLYDFYWLNRVVLMAIIGAVAMWAGFNSFWAKRLAAWIRHAKIFDRILVKKVRLRWWFVVTAILASIAARLLLVSLGAFGYSSDISQLYALGPYRFYINLFVGLGLLALVGLSLNHFTRSRPDPVSLAMLLGVLTLEIFFGLLSGYKGATVMPMVIVGICYYVARGRIPRVQILAALGLLFLAYQIVEPFRQMRVHEGNFDNRSAAYMANTITEIAAGETTETYEEGVTDTVVQVFARQNTVAFAALAMRARDEGRVGQKSAEFRRDLLLSPAYAVIPRLIWRSKPTQELGEWFNRVVLDNPFRNAVGMSPVGYLYIAGGATGVFLIFLVLGASQRVLLEGFLFAGAGGVVVFLGLANGLVRVDNAVYAVFVELIRNLPIMLVAQLLLFRPAPKPSPAYPEHAQSAAPLKAPLRLHESG